MKLKANFNFSPEQRIAIKRSKQQQQKKVAFHTSQKSKIGCSVYLTFSSSSAVSILMGTDLCSMIPSCSRSARCKSADLVG